MTSCRSSSPPSTAWTWSTKRLLIDRGPRFGFCSDPKKVSRKREATRFFFVSGEKARGHTCCSTPPYSEVTVKGCVRQSTESDTCVRGVLHVASTCAIDTGVEHSGVLYNRTQRHQVFDIRFFDRPQIVDVGGLGGPGLLVKW